MKVGREKGLNGTDDEVAVESIAHAAADLLRAGQVRDVLAIFAQASAKGDEDGAGGLESPLQRAMNRLPGLRGGAGVSLAALEQDAKPAESQENELRPTDPLLVTRSEQPFFSPQQTLIPPHLEPAYPAQRVPDSVRELVPAARAEPAGPGRAPPYPPPRGPRAGSRLETENLEKNPEKNPEGDA